MTKNFHYLLICACLAVATNVGAQTPAKMAEPAKAKYAAYSTGDKWEFGVNVGYAQNVSADVPFAPGFGLGLHLRKALDYTFSLRADINFLQLNGETPKNSGVNQQYEYGGPATKNNNVNDPRSFTAYHTPLLAGDLNLLISLNNGRWEEGLRWINPYIFVGVGGGYVNTTLDGVKGGTTAENGDGKDFTINGRNNGNYFGHVTGGAGISFRVNDKFNIGIEEKLYVLFGKRADLLDGYAFSYRDIPSYTNVRLNFNFGGGKDGKKTLPLWWIGPADKMQADLAEVQRRPKYDPTDTDGDGVIDILDQEKESPAGARVDTRGVALDSDSDGIIDGKDSEPFSPIGFKVDAKGVAQVPKPAYMTQPEVEKLIADKLAAFKATIPTTSTTAAASMADWFLPMIHFDLNAAAIRTAEYGNLESVATVMKNNPSVRIAVTGHTDRSAGDGYNKSLSYRRAQAAIDHLVKKYNVDRSRLVLNYEGETETLVPDSGRNFMNRRVEFKVAQAESEMSAPTKADAKKMKSYKGNKNAGY
jgi:OmpA-OmpF porin, OOP family